MASLGSALCLANQRTNNCHFVPGQPAACSLACSCYNSCIQTCLPYRQLNQEAHTAIEACGGTAQGQSAMAKLNTKMGIGMKTLTDKSTRNLAEMLSEGSSQGVMDCIKSQKDYPDAAPGSKRLMQRLQDFEEDNRIKLEQFL